MNLVITRPNKTDLQIIGALWLLAFPLLFFYYSNISSYASRLVIMLTDVVFLNTIIYVVVYILFPSLFQQKKYLWFAISFFALQILFSSLCYLIYYWLGANWDEYNFWNFVFSDSIENTKSLGFFIALLVTKKFYESKSDLLELEKERKTNELKWLKSQIDPHFLFNNLNALDDLIDRDKEQAKTYLHKLSALYRYLITNQEQDIVPLQEEWSFVDNYIYLLQVRYGGVYQFVKNKQLDSLDHLLIPPASLQGLIENVVKHNHGSEATPLRVEINIDQQGITVTHLKQPKRAGVHSHGTGLQNLKSRYELLIEKTIEIEDGRYFTVRLPHIRQVA